MRTKEMEEMDKAFEDFSKACDEAIGACQDFIDMDINKTTEPTLEVQGSNLPSPMMCEKIPTQRDEVANQTFYYW